VLMECFHPGAAFLRAWRLREAQPSTSKLIPAMGEVISISDALCKVSEVVFWPDDSRAGVETFINLSFRYLHYR